MNKDQTASLRQSAASFISFLKLTNGPAILFVSKPSIKECKVNEYFKDKNAIYFNSDFFDEMDERFVLLLILHEIYHYAFQGIKSINDVTYIRDNRMWHLMQLCDVEADIHVAFYLKQQGVINSFEEYMQVYLRGTSIFKDKHLRQPKLERFIGSISSIRELFLQNKKIVYLPSLSFTSTLITVVDFSKASFVYTKTSLPIEHLKGWEKVYQGFDSMTEKEYVSHVTRLSDEFLTQFNAHLYA